MVFHIVEKSMFEAKMHLCVSEIQNRWLVPPIKSRWDKTRTHPSPKFLLVLTSLQHYQSHIFNDLWAFG